MAFDVLNVFLLSSAKFEQSLKRPFQNCAEYNKYAVTTWLNGIAAGPLIRQRTVEYSLVFFSTSTHQAESCTTSMIVFTASKQICSFKWYISIEPVAMKGGLLSIKGQKMIL